MSFVSDLVATAAAERAMIAHVPPRLPHSWESGAHPTVTSRTVRVFEHDRLRDAFGAGPVEHRLLEPGAFDAHLLRVDTAEFALAIVRYSLPVAVKGNWPAGRIALAFALNMPGGAVALGQAHHTGALALFDATTGFDARLPAGAQWAVLTLDRDRFDAQALRGCGEAAPPRIRAGVPLHVCEPERRRLDGLLRAVIDSPGLTSHLLQMPGSARSLERQLVTAYVMAFVTAELPRPPGRGSLQRRYRLARKAEDYVFAHLDESVRMGALCREVGASARSLEYAFQAVYGMGAMQYLRAVRLNEVRKALLRSDGAAPTTVTIAAMDWGFWHLGEFSASYKRLFGELPSETLQCGAVEKYRAGLGRAERQRFAEEKPAAYAG